LKNYAFLVHIYYMHLGYHTSIFGKKIVHIIIPGITFEFLR